MTIFQHVDISEATLRAAEAMGSRLRAEAVTNAINRLLGNLKAQVARTIGAASA